MKVYTFLHLSNLVLLCQASIDVIDLSEVCYNNIKLNFFVTYGMGSSDGIVLEFAQKQKECKLNLYTHKGDADVLKFIAIEGLRESCHGFTISNHNRSIEVCNMLRSFRNKSLYSSTYSHAKTAVVVKNADDGVIKILAASGKVLSETRYCDQESSFLCLMDSKRICMSLELKCDLIKYCENFLNYQNTDCPMDYNFLLTGSASQETKLTTLIVVLALIATAITFCLSYKLVPKIPNSFFTTSPAFDNTLIITRSDVSQIRRKLSLKAINVSSQCEEEATTCDAMNSNRTAKKKQKRLTTNSPVYRLHSTRNLLLESLIGCDEEITGSSYTLTSADEDEEVEEVKKFTDNVLFKKQRHIIVPRL